jgi:hypothetical protein
MEQPYKIVSIEKSASPPGNDGSTWYSYVIAFGGMSTVNGCRQGSLKDVTTAVDEIIEQLNDRHFKKRNKEKKS